MVRYAFLGCAGLGLALSATALAAEELEAQAPVAGDVQPAAPRIKRVPRKVAVLPPARPAEEADSGIAAIVEAAPEQSVPMLAGSEAPLPAEFRLSTAAADAPAAPAPAIKVASIATLPPLRPSFPTGAQASASQGETAASEPEAGPVPPSRPEIVEVPTVSMTVAAVLPPERPAFPSDGALVQNASLPEAQPAPQPQQPRSLFGALFGIPAQPAPATPAEEAMIDTGRGFLDQRIAYHAKLNAVPAALVHRVVVRESKYNPRAVGRGGALGLMQIKHGTARALGYDGAPGGLLDAETNLTYAVKYLAGAYRLADGNYDRAVQHYARGYYYEAKRRNARLALGQRNERRQRQADAAAAIEQNSTDTSAAPRSLFGTR